MRTAHAEIARLCPACGTRALIGHGSRGRTNQVRPVARPPKRTRIGRVRGITCGRTHTLMPAELGPNKRYHLSILEQAAGAIRDHAATPYARSSPTHP